MSAELFQNRHFIVAGSHICTGYVDELSPRVCHERLRNMCKCPAHVRLRSDRKKAIDTYRRPYDVRTGVFDIAGYQHVDALLAAIRNVDLAPGDHVEGCYLSIPASMCQCGIPDRSRSGEPKPVSLPNALEVDAS